MRRVEASRLVAEARAANGRDINMLHDAIERVADAIEAICAEPTSEDLHDAVKRVDGIFKDADEAKALRAENERLRKAIDEALDVLALPMQHNTTFAATLSHATAVACKAADILRRAER